VALSAEVIEISSDSDDEPRIVVRSAPQQKAKKTSKRKTNRSNQIQVTRQQWVDRVVSLDCLPSSFDISENEVVGYLIDTDTVDYNRWKRAENTMKGIGRLKHEVIFSLSISIGLQLTTHLNRVKTPGVAAQQAPPTLEIVQRYSYSVQHQFAVNGLATSVRVHMDASF
jgi:hypothetical protein